MPDELRRQIGLFARARHEQCRGQRNQEAPAPGVTSPSPIVSLVKIAAASVTFMPDSTTPMNKPPTMLTSDDHDAGDGVAAHELAGTVHGAEEIGLARDVRAAALGLLLVDQAGRQVGVDGHLPAGHAVQGEAGGHFADARGALW